MPAHPPILSTSHLLSDSKGGESLSLTTHFRNDYGEVGTDGVLLVYFTQELTLHSYGNSATFTLCSNPLSPLLLRELATKLEKDLIQAQGYKKTLTLTDTTL